MAAADRHGDSGIDRRGLLGLGAAAAVAGWRVAASALTGWNAGQVVGVWRFDASLRAAAMNELRIVDPNPACPIVEPK